MYKPIILVFGEDSDVVIKIANVLSKSKKYQIYIAYSIEEAVGVVKKKNGSLFKLSRNKVKLAIFETGMPEGLEILRQIVKIDPNLRTIIVSSDVQMSYWLDACLSYNAIAYIPKPVNEDELIWTADIFFQGKESLIKSWTFRDISLIGRG